MSHYEEVIKFNEAARGALPTVPTELTLDQVKLAIRLVLEETFEVIEASLKPASPVLARMRQHKDAMQFTLANETTEADLDQDDVALLDGLCDTLVVAMGMAAMAGLPLDEGMDVVNASNLAKIDPVTGVCIKDAGGKIQKPAGWKKPDLEAVIQYGERFGNRRSVEATAASRLSAVGQAVPVRLEDL
jgi:predicted HAD superfamily Cof-like phosphohydrolase